MNYVGSERSLLLLKIYPESKAIIDNASERFMRKDLARDDILDALVLAVCAGLPLSSIRTVPPNPPTDKMGPPMEIVYFVLNRANAAGMSY
jgi:predicted RNase H-like nuclease